MGKRDKKVIEFLKANKIVFLVLSLSVSLILAVAVPLHLLSVYPPGWEMYNQVAAIRHNNVIMNSESDFTTPKELMGVYWKVDWDNETYGAPTIQVQMGDLRHVDFMGREIPSTQPADSVQFERGNYSYYLDYHIYMYTVTIRTVADKEIVSVTGLLDMATIHHETSWQYVCYTPFGSSTGETGETFNGGVYVKFVIDPWKGFTYHDPPAADNPDEWYVLDSCWAGIMNTYVVDKRMGQIENQWGQRPSDEDGEIFVKGALDEGNQVPMFLDDGSFGTAAPRIDWDPYVTPDERIESSVVQYLPMQMLPGADVLFNAYGASANLYPCDVYIMYTLRVDVLTTHGFILNTAHQPPESNPPTDYFSWAEDFWDSVFARIGLLNPFLIFGPYAGIVAFLFTLGVIVIVILVLLAIFAPWALRRLTKETRKGYETLKGKKGV